MTAPILSPSRPRLRLGVALAISALLHGGAVAMARLHGPASAADFSTDWKKLPAVAVELEENPVPSTPPLELPDLSAPPIPDDPPMFTDALPARLSPQPTKLSPISKKAPQSEAGQKTPSARALALHAPLPEYPYEARRARIVGDGVAILDVDSATAAWLTLRWHKALAALLWTEPQSPGCGAGVFAPARLHECAVRSPIRSPARCSNKSPTAYFEMRTSSLRPLN